MVYTFLNKKDKWDLIPGFVLSKTTNIKAHFKHLLKTFSYQCVLLVLFSHASVNGVQYTYNMNICICIS